MAKMHLYIHRARFRGSNLKRFYKNQNGWALAQQPRPRVRVRTKKILVVRPVIVQITQQERTMQFIQPYR